MNPRDELLNQWFDTHGRTQEFIRTALQRLTQSHIKTSAIYNLFAWNQREEKYHIQDLIYDIYMEANRETLFEFWFTIYDEGHNEEYEEEEQTLMKESAAYLFEQNVGLFRTYDELAMMSRDAQLERINELTEMEIDFLRWVLQECLSIERHLIDRNILDMILREQEARISHMGLNNHITAIQEQIELRRNDVYAAERRTYDMAPGRVNTVGNTDFDFSEITTHLQDFRYTTNNPSTRPFITPTNQTESEEEPMTYVRQFYAPGEIVIYDNTYPGIVARTKPHNIHKPRGNSDVTILLSTSPDETSWAMHSLPVRAVRSTGEAIPFNTYFHSQGIVPLIRPQHEKEAIQRLVDGENLVLRDHRESAGYNVQELIDALTRHNDELQGSPLLQLRYEELLIAQGQINKDVYYGETVKVLEGESYWATDIFHENSCRDILQS